MGHRWNCNNPFSKSKCYCKEWLKTLVEYITPPAEALVTTLKISRDSDVKFSVQGSTRRQRGGEPGPRTFISDLQQIMPRVGKWQSLLNSDENKGRSYPLFCEYSQKIDKNAPIIIIDGENTCRIEGRVSPLKLLVGSHYVLQNRVEMLHS